MRPRRGPSTLRGSSRAAPELFLPNSQPPRRESLPRRREPSFRNSAGHPLPQRASAPSPLAKPLGLPLLGSLVAAGSLLPLALYGSAQGPHTALPPDPVVPAMPRAGGREASISWRLTTIASLCASVVARANAFLK